MAVAVVYAGCDAAVGSRVKAARGIPTVTRRQKIFWAAPLVLSAAVLTPVRVADTRAVGLARASLPTVIVALDICAGRPRVSVGAEAGPVVAYAVDARRLTRKPGRA
jgi:hypothetical protein